MLGRIVRTGLIVLPIVLIGLLLSGCGSVIDADQARICRAIPEALNQDGAAITETSLSPVPGQPTALRLAYRLRIGDMMLARWIVCEFAAQSGVGRFNLVGVTTDRGPLSGVKLLILKRWWLEDIRVEQGFAPLFHLGPHAAYWLQQALNGMVLAGVYGLIATGFALIYGLVGRINFAFGEIAVAGGVNTLILVGVSTFFGRLSGPILALALFAGIAAAALLSWTAGRTIVLPLATRSRAPQTTLIGTLALAIVLSELIRLTAPDRLNWLPALLNRPLYLAGAESFVATVTPAQLLGAGLAMSGASLLLGLMTFSNFGRSWRAHAEDPLMAAMLGVPIPLLRSLTFIIAGASAGLAGAVVVVAYGTIQAGDGLSLTLKALISAIIGGIGSVPGAFLGAALVAGVEIVWSSAFDIAYRDVVTYSLLAAFLMLRPGGLLNRAAPSPREF
ncbi:branched-chain amino acid ABC transporter permease [Ancylobacter pratisalsi]|uniref:Branched-chain amino acid ABC transporter permease n=1 Tax=Ancylobacter pratisalsi TaxID=1745854 RepID=A0A6P1YRY6_9HYPH|nr:branched-chain amino acid ABC transporter permease [Ancylobacter pratisalsi]QIB35892.1 branched-chain amino acid ABC transporter permease [Ancylobacter pratisalsi]